MKYSAIIFSLFSLFMTSKAAASEDLLGRTVVFESKSEYAKIPISNCRFAKEIQVQAEADAFISKIVFHFQSGDEQEVHFHRKFDKNEKSQWREFSYRRCVSDIQVHGRALNQSAVIKLYAKK